MVSSPTLRGEPPVLGRRALFAGLAALAGCVPAAPPERPEPAPAKLGALGDALAAAGCEWLVLLEPERIQQTAWLRPLLGRILRDERLDLFAATTGVDLRVVPELVLASYLPRSDAGPESDGAASLTLCRHRGDVRSIERLFRDRLTRHESRSVPAEGVVVVSGDVGRKPQAFVAIGSDVVGFQSGGSRTHGPARVAALYALGSLASVPTVLAEQELGALLRALGPAPLRALLPGPFEGELGHGARGLFAAATAVGAAITPTEHQTLRCDVRLRGDYAPSPERAATLLSLAWKDLAASDLGHLCGVHEPLRPPVAEAGPEGPVLTVELDARTLFDGLAAATVDNVREIMR
ncbi:MAG: hypothetical protein HY908_29355 [Myxococcales bacterium]|nr:hypothetical protein [Myxococcales bacterium]